MFATFSAEAAHGALAARRLTAVALMSALFATGGMTGVGVAAVGDGAYHQPGAAAMLDGLKTHDRAVLRVDGEKHSIPAGLFEMTVEGGGLLKTYSVDVHSPTQEQAAYLETPWKQTSLGRNRNAGKIRWILQNSFPQVDDLAELAQRAGAGPLTQKTAAAGTQVAVWRQSDGARVEALDPAAEKLADWLQRRARSVAEPKASLSLEPSVVSGRPGGRIGPVTVRTGADRVELTPPVSATGGGVRVTDKAGKALTSATDGAQVYFDVPTDIEDGSATLAVQAATSVPVGRALTAATVRSQTQIVAGSSESTVSARATATWAAKGAMPALSARKDCTGGGVGITTRNTGDAPFAFEVGGGEHSVPAGESLTVTVPVGEDQPYDILVTGPEGFARSFKGVLDCRLTGPVAPSPTPGASSPTPSGLVPASAGGTGGELPGDLAATGGSGVVPLMTGIATALVVVGGAAVFLLRKKKTPTGK